MFLVIFMEHAEAAGIFLVLFQPRPRQEAHQKWHETRGGSVDHFIGIVDENISLGSLTTSSSIAQDDKVVMQGICSWTQQGDGKDLRNAEGRHLARPDRNIIGLRLNLAASRALQDKSR
jgi:hypothetical protein